jgi:hypothetical protein
VRAPQRTSRESASEYAALPSACRECGRQLDDRRRRYCQECQRQRFSAQADAARARGLETLARLRAEQTDPAHGGHAGEIRAGKNTAHQAAVRAWQGPPGDAAAFRAEILPGLSQVRTVEVMAATGLGQSFSSRIRLGKVIPHARHWPALRELASRAR